MDRMLACEAGDPGSIPGESTFKQRSCLNVLSRKPSRLSSRNRKGSPIFLRSSASIKWEACTDRVMVDSPFIRAQSVCLTLDRFALLAKTEFCRNSVDECALGTFVFASHWRSNPGVSDTLYSWYESSHNLTF